MSTAMSKAESNALVVSYDVLGTHVELDLDFVKKYLVRGKAELVSNQELVFFMNTCRQQKLNPLVQGEVYLIKYSKDDPAQMVVGKDAYLRRASVVAWLPQPRRLLLNVKAPQSRIQPTPHTSFTRPENSLQWFPEATTQALPVPLL